MKALFFACKRLQNLRVFIPRSDSHLPS
jgi:hypothetical protein